MLSSVDGHSVAHPALSATSAWGLLHPLPSHSCCLSARPRGWSGCLFPPSLNPAAGFVGEYSEPESILSGLWHGTSFLSPLPRCSAPSTGPCPSPTTFPGTEFRQGHPMDFLIPHLKVLFAAMCCFLAGLVLTAPFPASSSFPCSTGGNVLCLHEAAVLSLCPEQELAPESQFCRG